MTILTSHYQWHIADYDRSRAAALAEEVGLPPLIAHLLLLRGIDDSEKMRAFLTPSMRQLSDPLMLPDMAAAVERITLAKERDESVLVFGDYDVDGIAATAIMLNGLRRFGVRRVSGDMPDRFAEGYGLGPARVDQAREEGHGLLITVDCGISAHAAAERARAIGLDLIITDHHTLDGPLPPALAIVNPKCRPGDLFTAHLSGAGIALKLASAINGVANDLDIAALGTVSDIVPLLGENRVIVALGIKHIMRHKRVGIEQLARVARVDLRQLNAQRIGFQLGPRLNAAGRMDTGHSALELLLTDSESQAATLAANLNAANDERRAIEHEIFVEAVETLDAFLTEQQRSIVVFRDGWHQGVVGIVASRLQTQYHRPVIVCALGEDGFLHGSARSTPGFDMVGALAACRGHLKKFGGHAAAAGLTLAPEAMEAFRTDFEREALRQLGSGKLEIPLNIDALIAFSQVNSAFIRHLECMEPFGNGNPEPLFCAASVEVAPQSIRVLKDQHLKMSLKQGGVVLPAIGFRMAERFFTESFPKKLDIAFTPQFNTYNNETTVQLVLKDLRSAQ